MTRDNYIKQLKRELNKKLNPTEVNSVLEDYNDFFEAGLLEGKQEHELCKEFGFPTDIAKEIYNSQNRKGNISLKRILSYSLLLFFFVIYFLFQSIYAYQIEVSILITLLMPLVFIILHKIIKNYIVYPKNNIIKFLKAAALAPLFIYIFLWIFSNENGIIAWRYFFSGMPSGFEDMGSFGLSAQNNLLVLYFSGFAGLFFVLIKTHKNGINKWFSLTFLFAGLMQSSLCINAVLYTMNDIMEKIIYRFKLSLVPLIIGAICNILLFIFFPHFKKFISKINRKIQGGEM